MKQKMRKVLIIVFIILMLLLAYFIFKNLTNDKQMIKITYNSSVSANSPLEAIIGVVDENENTKKSTIFLELIDNNGKKVKGIKEKYKLEEGELANCSIQIPEDLESGSYRLKIKAISGIYTTDKEVDIKVLDNSNSEIIISLDKQMYKPGDTIKYSALLISKKNSTPKDNKEVNVEIYDGNGNRVYSETSNTTDFGVVFGEFSLASEVNSGTYSISVNGNSQKETKTFAVSPYVVPQFEVNIKPDKDVYKIGDTANITINAKYFFGEPVVNASIVGKIGNKDFTGLTDDNGNFIYTYKQEEKGKTNIDVTVIDTSNYLIESSSTIYAQEHEFEVELLPENGSIYKNIDNNIFFIARKIDGTPVKTHGNVTIGSIKRQVITDENGIGKILLTAEDTNNLGMESIVEIIAVDEAGNEYRNTSKIDVLVKSTIISTDKVRYNEGDDISINLGAITDKKNKVIYACKNGELIKMISADSNNIKINLGEVSGIIDLIIDEGQGRYYFNDDYLYDYMDDTFTLSDHSYRKTIFIKPKKSLDVAISTDKEEYKPGENATISFKTHDENGKNVTTNMLISIVDEAVLSLAENDLSMDNIRLALKDINLTDEVTLADLYADILSEQNDSRLMIALLKNNVPTNYSIIDAMLSEYTRKYFDYSILCGLAIFVVIIIYISISDNKKLISLVKDIMNVFALSIIFYYSYYSNYYYNNIGWESLIVTAIAVIMLYCLVLYKLRDKIFLIIKNLIIIPAVYMAILEFLDYKIDNNILFFGIIAVPIIMTFLIVWSRKKQLNAFWSFIKDITIELTKAGISYVIAYYICDEFYFDEIWFIIISLVSYLAINKIYEMKKNKQKINKPKFTSGEIVIIIVFIIGLAFLYNVLGKNVSTPYYNANDDYGLRKYNNDIDLTGIETFDGLTDSSGATGKAERKDLSDVFNFTNNKIQSATANEAHRKDEVIIDEVAIAEDSETQNSNNTSDAVENVRKVFLESLAFIPNLVIENGEGSTQIQLSDNITTWNIQAVGNTKNGNIGSSTKNFKVFKDFFIDFSLPTNSVVTDKTSIPVTVYNYKDEDLTVNLQAVANSWSTIGNYENSIKVDAQSTKLVYIPIEILASGTNTFRVEANAEGVSDIVEKTFLVVPNGFKKTKVVSSSTIDKSFSTDYFTTEEAIDNTRKVKVKIYPSSISQAIEGMESIFKMPTGCFEQTSSSLYPNILALKYLEDNGLDNKEIREKALDYISTGYQRLLTFEVDGVKGGYSLFGDNPAEPVITAFGLMELNDAKDVYNIDEQVLVNMENYLYSVQKINGSFDINNYLETGTASSSDLAMNAYIIWALSEVNPDDSRINKSVEYLESKINDIDDNYTLALMANVFTNVKSNETATAISKLMENIEETGENAFISSKIRDYYGSYGIYQNMQTTALTSMALSKNNLHSSTNNSFIRYLISNKDSFGNWGSTQATILALKAINMSSAKGKISGQVVSVTLNDKTENIKINDNALDFYEVEFSNIKNENKLNIEMKKGNLSFEIIEEYYVPYENIVPEKNKYDIDISETINTNVNVNDIITQKIDITNKTNESISNGLVTINIPQGCTVDQNFLEKCKTLGNIEKYDYNYSALNLYIRNFKAGESKTLEVQYRATYPEEITGGTIRVFDYYNPNIEGIKVPEKIVVK